MVTGFWATLGVGVLGGFIAELIRVLSAFRLNRPPRRFEYWVSLGYVLLGAGAVFYGWSSKQAAIEVATLGAAFPALFAAGVRAAAPPPSPTPSLAPEAPGVHRSLLQFLASRF
jgi:hypothetical protein